MKSLLLSVRVLQHRAKEGLPLASSAGRRFQASAFQSYHTDWSQPCWLLVNLQGKQTCLFSPVTRERLGLGANSFMARGGLREKGLHQVLCCHWLNLACTVGHDLTHVGRKWSIILWGSSDAPQRLISLSLSRKNAAYFKFLFGVFKNQFFCCALHTPLKEKNVCYQFLACKKLQFLLPSLQGICDGA